MNIVIKTFKTINGNYVYDRETNSILSVNLKDYEMLVRLEQNNIYDSDKEILEKYWEQGFLKPTKLERIEHPATSRLKFYLQNRIEQITLQVTQNCNLRCAYCAYSGKYNQRTHNNRVMSLDTMKKSIDFAIRHSYGLESLDVGFYGGEPLLEIRNISNLIDYINEMYPDKLINYNLTTNGTVFTDEIIEFLIKNNFSVLISLDGPKEVHDENRKLHNGVGTFDKIMENLNYVKNVYPDFFKRISFNTVIAPGSDYESIIHFFDNSTIVGQNEVSRVTVSEYDLKDEIRYDDKYYITQRQQSLKLLLSKLNMYDKRNVSRLFLRDFMSTYRIYKELGNISELPKLGHPGGPCVPGAKRPMIDVDGNIFPCERVNENSENMCIGNIDSGFEIEKIEKILNIGRITEKQCLKCWNFLYCGLCAAAAEESECISSRKRLSYCEMSRIDTLNTLKDICFLKENNYAFIEEL